MPRDKPEQPSSGEMRAFAYRLLGRREYSVLELAQRIDRKWPDAHGVSDLLDALKEENLLSDERFAESFVRFRARRHQGPVKIRADLRMRGVSESTISSHLDSGALDWTDLAERWLNRQISGELSFEDRKKYYRRLLNRGFTHDQAMDSLNRLS